ncbi:MAG: polysaccharide pyruvyl transferase family protein [Pirellulaceae bacterium]|nr:polysaccharide pyruvyl transferase family protein [Pirellulaceae bacterium]
MPGLPVSAYAEVFEPLRGRRIGYVRPLGNVGDRLIEWATEQLLDTYGIDWVDWTPATAPEVDELVFGGGGNMGAHYRANWDLRTRCLQSGLPVTILPQSFLGEEPRAYKRVFVRERASWPFCPAAVLAPDLALGLRIATYPPPKRELGLMLRVDKENRVRRPWFCRDPVELCRTPRQYLELAARYERIVTDRLHFAVCGLLLGRDTTILPNAYHKNRGMYETWLADLGCHFAETPAEALRRAGWRSRWLPAA